MLIFFFTLSITAELMIILLFIDAVRRSRCASVEKLCARFAVCARAMMPLALRAPCQRASHGARTLIEYTAASYAPADDMMMPDVTPRRRYAGAKRDMRATRVLRSAAR